MAVESSHSSFPDAGRWVRPTVGAAPGMWSARLHVAVDRPIAAIGTLEVQGGFEFFIDSESIARSDSAAAHDAVTHHEFELNLLSGRHELFIRLWTVLDGPPTFRLGTRPYAEWFSTGNAPWTMARSENVQLTHPLLARVLMIGEPTGPGGMNRGAVWQPLETLPESGNGSWDWAVQLQPVVGAETWEAELVEGEGTIDGFLSVLGAGGLFQVAPEQTVIVRIALPQNPVHVSLRASGGENALIRFGTEDDPINADVFGPRGFRQDFASLAPFEGDEITITLEGGERGMALFHLEFLEERGA